MPSSSPSRLAPLFFLPLPSFSSFSSSFSSPFLATLACSVSCRGSQQGQEREQQQREGRSEEGREGHAFLRAEGRIFRGFFGKKVVGNERVSRGKRKRLFPFSFSLTLALFLSFFASRFPFHPHALSFFLHQFLLFQLHERIRLFSS